MHSTPGKIYVMLGFHTSFYHSWRGDTPDEAGFGVDIRVVRTILRMLDEANAAGLQARGYWDLDVFWTIEKIIQPYAPDILDSIRRRINARQDEVVLGSYNNGANHAATLCELKTALEYARSNPFGSGLEQLFGRVTPIMRPQECMLSSGQNALYRQAGIEGLILYYAGVPFNTFGAFIPPLPPQQRYNLLCLRSHPEDTPLEVWPCISQLDLFENTCLEALLLRLRHLQESGQVQNDLLVHLNFDADADLWLPVKLPRWLAWFPNLGGLREMIQVVNRYPWAEFTTPSEYRPQHPPQADIIVRQDLADGGFDGNYSWAEKFTSFQNWTLLEQARLRTCQAEALLPRVPLELSQELRARLWEGRQSVFFHRVIALSTTHFGMSTPVINSERQAVAHSLLSQARSEAAQVVREAAQVIRNREKVNVHPGKENLYQFEVSASDGPQHHGSQNVRTVVRLPVLLPAGVPQAELYDTQGQPIRSSFVNPSLLPSGALAGELLFWVQLSSGQPQRFHLAKSDSLRPRPTPLTQLRNPWLNLVLSESSGIQMLSYQDAQIGAEGFLQPRITYRDRKRPVSWGAQGYTISSLHSEHWNGLQRARLKTNIPMKVQGKILHTGLTYTFTLFDDLPYLLVDAEISYARTPARDMIENAQQRLRRWIDLRWIETAPCQFKPNLTARAGQRPLRVWKHNALGVTSYYDLDYGAINPRNRDIDSFNHQVTHGWVAVSDGQHGLLLAECAEKLASMAFCPMRLREVDGFQHLWLNPFGTYFGHQLDYAHLGGNGAGAKLTETASSAQRPNAPSFNGQKLQFSLLLAPYCGDAPDPQLQADAQAFFYPPAVVLMHTPEKLQAVTSMEVEALIRAGRSLDPTGSAQPLPVPCNLLASPAEQSIDLTWESDPDDRIQSFEVRWRSSIENDWAANKTLQGTHLRLDGLQHGRSYFFQVRAIGVCSGSAWSAIASAKAGTVRAQTMVGLGRSVPFRILARLLLGSLGHAIFTSLTRHWQQTRKSTSSTDRTENRHPSRE
jgi:hypothetical protein